MRKLLQKIYPSDPPSSDPAAAALDLLSSDLLPFTNSSLPLPSSSAPSHAVPSSPFDNPFDDDVDVSSTANEEDDQEYERDEGYDDLGGGNDDCYAGEYDTEYESAPRTGTTSFSPYSNPFDESPHQPSFSNPFQDPQTPSSDPFDEGSTFSPSIPSSPFVRSPFDD